jgi:type VI secretion system protein ImpM
LRSARPALGGYYGKLPCAGDFVRRGLDQAIRAAVDRWLQEGLARERLTWSVPARPWRFAAATGVFGPTALAGLLASSHDKVGRRFPIFLAAEPRASQTGAEEETWFTAAETLLQEALTGARDADALAQGLAALERPWVVGRLAEAAALLGPAGSAWWSGEDFVDRIVFENELDAAALQILTSPWRRRETHQNLSQSPSSDDKGQAS